MKRRFVLLGLLVLGTGVSPMAASAQTLEPSPLAWSGGLGASEQAVFMTPPEGATFAVKRTPRRTPRYVPPPPPPRGPQGWITMRGGGYDGEQVSENDWTIGMEMLGNVTPMLRLGGSIDYLRRDDSQRTIVTEYVDGSGNVVRSEATVAESESNLWPMMAVLKVVFPTPTVQPYAGIAGGWEFLHVEAFDYRTGYGYHADYDGPGWQVFGGIGFAMGPRAVLNAEVFHNEAEVDREVYDPYVGVLYDEEIDVDGTGARVGLSFAF